MKDLIESIFGVYEPVTYQVVNKIVSTDSTVMEGYTSVNSTITSWTDTVIPEGFAGVDWTYVLGVLGFFLVLYCILRIIGTVISRV